ncbi:transcription factor bHLH51 [Canna indica]|uniref:Transcription factor bHLH51 n=1 Tax=Canna indica TaxID=4628 RepID=A0AAQ3K9G8_9LILI|nr:transcription factor bHLH51 [Canna indica]
MAICKDVSSSFFSSSSSSSLPFHGATDPSSGFMPTPAPEAKSSAALRIHSEAEKRRRDRINAHLSTLRRMIPDSSKMDKASLLGRVIEQVKCLKRKASEISRESTVPREVNEVSVKCSINHNLKHKSSSHDDDVYIEASVCCEDRPHLFAELSEAFQNMRLKTVKAEVTSFGGRVHNVFTLCLEMGNESVNLSSFKEAITQALDTIASRDIKPSSTFLSKRRRC